MTMITSEAREKEREIEAAHHDRVNKRIADLERWHCVGGLVGGGPRGELENRARAEVVEFLERDPLNLVSLTLDDLPLASVIKAITSVVERHAADWGIDGAFDNCMEAFEGWLECGGQGARAFGACVLSHPIYTHPDFDSFKSPFEKYVEYWCLSLEEQEKINTAE